MSLPEEATHPRCYGEGYRIGRAEPQNKEGELWTITGYGLYRLIRKLGHDCMVAAPSLIPKKPGG